MDVIFIWGINLCYRIKNQEKKIYLSKNKAIELALTTEIPINEPISLFEIAIIIWDIQTRPWYSSELVSIYNIKYFLNELIIKEPRKVIELENDYFLIKYL
ncbi:MAG: hypothetical protein EAX96_14300 [Candidatus Lokiarchaeota archaeon]|nr:hypothetical protein [Candidatus Lokiarchaeota archaeon]